MPQAQSLESPSFRYIYRLARTVVKPLTPFFLRVSFSLPLYHPPCLQELVPYLLPRLLDHCLSLATQLHSTSEQQAVSATGATAPAPAPPAVAVAGAGAVAGVAAGSAGATSKGTDEGTRTGVEALAYPLAQALIDVVLAVRQVALLAMHLLRRRCLPTFTRITVSSQQWETLDFARVNHNATCFAVLLWHCITLR